MDPSGDGGGGLTATGLFCGSCGTELPPNSKFCNECGAPVTQATRSAEYKQVTVLFADVVHSMDIAAAVGAERLREIMAELVDRARRWCSGTAARWTSSPATGSWRCSVRRWRWRTTLFAPVWRRWAFKRRRSGSPSRSKTATVSELQLRVGLNSGQVIAGEIGSGPFGYTAVGEQVGMAQRMESVAPPGGVMLSASTARLVDGAAALGEPELVQIKGADKPVAAQRLLGMGNGIASSSASSRIWSVGGGRCPPLRACWTAQSTATALWSVWSGHLASARAVWCARCLRWRPPVVSRCSLPSASRTPARSPSMPSRGCCARPLVSTGLDGQAARDRVRDRVPDADPEDLVLFDDLLGIADPDAPLPAIDPDARRRRLTALVNAASLARETPAVYVVEDAHWIDEVSESMLADFLTVIPQTPSLVLVTYRPEYRGRIDAGARCANHSPCAAE